MKKKLFIIIVALVALFALLTYGVLNYGYSKGARSGKLVKLSKKGVLIKTYEGTLDLGSGDMLTWEFSVHDKAVGEELLNHIGRQVTLNYRELFFKLFFSTKYDVRTFSFPKDPQALDYLCRMVDIVRKRPKLVDQLREVMQEYDPSLLNMVRECQQR